MLPYQQTPVGEKIKLGEPNFDNEIIESFFKPYNIKYYDSGTSALAVAILACINKKNIKTPEIIMPAYSCPDLVSAILYAGGSPVLVDFVKNRPWMDLDQLQEKITPNTVAVIAVNLFGIPERLQEIKDLTSKEDITLIEDNAQSFPVSENTIKWTGDVVVLSFGRGKPVNMLTGGAVLFLENGIGEILPEFQYPVNSSFIEDIKYRIKASIYNMTISPYLYGCLEKLPFLHVGETRFNNHHSIEPMNSATMTYLHRNIELFFERKNEIRNRYTELLSTLHNDRIIDLPTECCDSNIPYLLRYPVLCSDVDYREKIYLDLRKNGIGASLMYQKIIPEIEGLYDLLQDEKKYINAKEFASRLLTLPVHQRITERDHNIIQNVFSINIEDNSNTLKKQV